MFLNCHSERSEEPLASLRISPLIEEFPPRLLLLEVLFPTVFLSAAKNPMPACATPGGSRNFRPGGAAKLSPERSALGKVIEVP